MFAGGNPRTLQNSDLKNKRHFVILFFFPKGGKDEIKISSVIYQRLEALLERGRLR